MKKILFVNACPRGKESRTLRLAETFMKTLQSCGSFDITRQDLPDMRLQPVDAETLAMKESLCDVHAWDAPYLAPAAAFQRADAVVIAAPYWDMSFPSILKIWVENMYVRNLTFKYINDQSVGLCQGSETVYITTAGSPIGENDWGAGYIRAVMNTLGIPGFTSLRAESLDLAGSDPAAIMAEAEACAKEAAKTLAQRLKAVSIP